VAVSTLGKLFTTPVDGQVYGQPLIMTGVNITTGASQGLHNVAFVATQHDSVYAIDADTGAVLWQDSFVNPAAGVTTVPSTDCNCSDVSPQYGITSTPVIDPATNTLYTDTRTKEVIAGINHYIYRLHALSLSDGSENFGGPVVIADTSFDGTSYGYISGPSVRGNGAGGDKSNVPFNSLRELQRTGLTIANGSVYLAFGSQCDNNPYHGWVLGYDLQTLQPTAVLCTTPNGTQGGIWMSGGSIIADSVGNLFLEVGNGSFNANTLPRAFPTDANYGNAFLRLIPDPGSTPSNPNANGWGLAVADFFVPNNFAVLNQNDRDVGSGGIMLLPDSLGSSTTPHLMVGGSKEGRIYLLNRDNLGRFDPNGDHVVQQFLLPDGVFDTPALFNNWIYFAAAFHFTEHATAYSISNGVLSTSPVSQSSDIFNWPGSTPSISANGTNNGIAWMMDRSRNQLRAFDASNLANELWTSAQAPNNRDALGTVVKFTVPTVANGRVYVGTASSLVTYGLLNSVSTPPQAPTNLTAEPVSSSQINLTWSDPPNNNENGFNIERSTDGVTFQPSGTAPAGATSFLVTALQPSTSYTFRVYAFNGAGNSPFSNTAMATTMSQASSLDFSNGFAGSSVSLSYNGASRINGTRLELTDGGTNEKASVFSRQAVDIAHFNTRFSFQLHDGTNPQAEGFTFVVQGVGATTLGSAGSGLGYGADATGHPSISSSIAVKFDLFDDSGEGNDSTGLYLNGATPTQNGSIDLTATGLDLQSGHVFNVVLISDGSTLQVSITDSTSGQSAVQTYSVNIPATVGASTGYVGFTGSTGSSTAVQDILTWTYTPTASLPPFAPTNLTAAATSGSDVHLSWTDNSSTETGFQIDRATDAAFTQNVETQTSAANSGTTAGFNDSNLTAGVTYYYRVRATNAFGDSFNSNIVNVTPPTIPLTPSNARATLVTTTEIDLAWDDNSNNEDGFHIFRRDGGAGLFNLIATLPPNTTTFANPGLRPATQYDYHIQAFNVAGFADFAGITVSTLSGTPPPSNLLATSGTGQINLTWSGVSGASSYNIYRGTAAGAETLYVTGVVSPFFGDTGLGNGVTYFYQVTAILSGTESARSGEAFATTAPVAPSNPTARAGSEQVTLSWTAPHGAQSYNLYRATAQGAETLLHTGITAASFTDSDLNDSTTYYYQVSAVASGAEGPRSAEVFATPFADHLQLDAPPNTSAGAPFSVTVTARDRSGNVLFGYRGTIHFTSSDTGSGLVLPGDYTFVAADRGRHSFLVTLVSTGTQTVTAQDLLARSTKGNARLTVNPTSLPTFVLRTSTTAVAGVPFNLFVQVVDGTGQSIPTYTGTVHFSSSDPAATLPSDYTFQASEGGVHTFTNLIFTTSLSQTIIVADTANPAITKTLNFKVNPGAATHFNIFAPPAVTAGEAFTMTVIAADAFGNRVNGYRGTVLFKSSDAAATLPGNYSFTDADQGQHVFTAGARTALVADTANSSLKSKITVQVNSPPMSAGIRSEFDKDWTRLRSMLDMVFSEEDNGFSH
jgi:fibronectin type 3 domain-containing protein